MKFKYVENLEHNETVFKNLVPLTEASLLRIVNGHDKDGYAMVSASRGDNSESKNNINYNEMCKKVKDLGYSYVPAYGGYKEAGSERASVEKSLIVFPFNIETKEITDFNKFFNDMVDMCGEDGYKQDAILVKRPDAKPAYYYLKDVDYGPEHHDKYTWGSPFNGASINDIQREYFTALKSWKDISLNKSGRDEWQGSPQRFTYTESYLRESPHTIMGRHARYHEGELLDPKYPD